MIRRFARKGPRLFAPQVVQTSAMDCGPAALKCLLEGFGVPASYARLLEACHTDVDGTSIDAIEQVAVTLGLAAEQIMLPVDHLLLGAAHALPALVVVRRDNMTHFIVVWQTYGPFVQLMDPAKGRRWLREEAFQRELYVHQQIVPANGWREWAGSREFLDAVDQRLDRVRVPAAVARRVVSEAEADPRWVGLATLDAAIRMVSGLASAGGLRRGPDAGRVLEMLVARAKDPRDPRPLVPADYWSVLRAPANEGDESDESLVLRGAVLMRVRERRAEDELPQAELPQAEHSQAERSEAESVRQDRERVELRETLKPVIGEAHAGPFLEAWRVIRRNGIASPLVIAAGLVLAAGGALFEMLLFRGILEIGQLVSLREQRMLTALIVLGYVAGLLLLDVAIFGGLLRLGRRMEAQLRVALLERLPNLSERYLHSRLVADLAHRAHSLDALRTMPELGARFARTSMQLIFTAIGLAWLDPPSVWLALLSVGLALGIPLATTPVLGERELRQRSHAAALSRYYLDGLLGLVAARTHGAERALRQRHESLLIEWGRASLHLVRGAVVIEGLQMLVGSGLAALLVLDFVGRGGRPGSTLLLVYWALSLPMLGREVAGLLRQYPAYRNILARVLEPLRAPDDRAASSADAPARAQDQEQEEIDRDGRDAELPAPGVCVAFTGVEVRAAGHTILEDLTLTLRAGEHVAIVGRSGAGKSSLIGLLLGWRTATRGRLTIDGEPLDADRLTVLRRATAWVDPGVQLWNRSLFDNLRYGEVNASASNIGSVVSAADLTSVLEKLPDGLQTLLGEGGRLISGGEQQRVRFGRALVRPDVRLALLDEPFRGLDRQRRHDLLLLAREVWRQATMLCVTHDIEETLAFERVLVLDQGRVVEDGAPATLARTPESAYAALLAAERSVRSELWENAANAANAATEAASSIDAARGSQRAATSATTWRRWRVEQGAVVDETARAEVSWTTDQGSRGR
jgi:ABC-type bacteriocin/lantibiotic exporter with double-glycine peptidase domain